MNRSLLFLLPIIAAIALAACSDDPAPAPAAGEVRILCADVVNQGQASKCDAAPAGAAVMTEYIGGTVVAGGLLMSHVLVENTGPARNVTMPTYLDIECVPGGFDYPYATGQQSDGLLPTGTSEWGGGNSCATPGERRMYNPVYDDASIYYPGNPGTTEETIRSWVPGSDPDHLLDYAVTVFTVE